MKRSPQAAKVAASFPVSLFDSVKDNQAKPYTTDLQRLVGLVARPTIRTDKGGRLWSPASFRDGRRKKQSVAEISVLVLDLDGGITLDDASAILNVQGCGWLWHTTFSHTQQQPKFRVIIPLAAPIPAAQYPALWQWANDLFNGKLDPATKDASRIFFFPIHRQNAPYRCLYDVQKPLLDWQVLPLAQPVTKPTKPVAASKPATNGNGRRPKKYALAALQDECGKVASAPAGTRNNALNTAAFNLAQFIPDGSLDEGTIRIELTQAAEVAGLDATEIAATLRSGIEAGIKQPRPLPEMNGKLAKDDLRLAVDSGDDTAPLCFTTQPGERGQVVLTAKRGATVIHIDTLNLTSASKRAAYIEALQLPADEVTSAHQALLDLASRPAAATIPTKQREEKCVTFAKLSDGRLIEQLAGGRFVVFDGSQSDVNSQVSYADEVVDGDVTYRPDTDTLIAEQNELKFPDCVTEYGTEQELDTSIAVYIHRFVELKHLRDRLIVAALIRLSWIQDQLNEVPYLHATGEKGSGKSRLLKVLSWLCYRTLVTVQISESALFRICHKYHPTLLVDEFNPRVDNDDAKSLMQILNGGYDRDLAKVYRTEKTADGNFTQRMYRCFGMKIFSGLEKTESAAFESRTVPIHLFKTERKDIQFSNTGAMEREAAIIRQQLQLWRLRNLANDWMAELIKAEEFLRQKPILPRFSQIAAPLTMLLDGATRHEFRAALTERTNEDTEERQDSLDGQIVKAIHQKLFGEVEPDKTEVETIVPEIDLKEGEPCEYLLVSELQSQVNIDRPEKFQISTKTFGKRLSALGLPTKKILSRQSKHRDKRAVIFSVTSLTEAFRQYRFPVFAKTNVTNVTKTDNHQETQQDTSGDIAQKEEPKKKKCHQMQNIESTLVTGFGDIGDIRKSETCKEASKSVLSPHPVTVKTVQKAR